MSRPRRSSLSPVSETPHDPYTICKKLTKPPETFMCPLVPPLTTLRVHSFHVHDADSGYVFVDMNIPQPSFEEYVAVLDHVGDEARRVDYVFDVGFLKAKRIAATIEFGTEPNETIQQLRMMERHYFRNKLIKSYEFDFGFVIPNSINSWESIYDVPALDRKMVADMVAHPKETVSDTFFFVDDKLVLHQKATYTFVDNKRI